MKMTTWLAGFAVLCIAASCSSEMGETDPAPTATLHVDRSIIEYGESIRLEWQTENATRVSISDQGEILFDSTAALSGKRTISPCFSTLIELTAEGPGGTVTTIVPVEVETAIYSFGPTSTEPVAPGAEVELAWKTLGAETLVITTPEGESFRVPETALDVGSARVKAGSSGTFTLTSRRGITRKTRESSVESVLHRPWITSFEASTLAIEPGRGRTVEFTWATEAATSASLWLEPGGPVDLSGRSPEFGWIAVWITEPTRTVFSATNAAGTVTRAIQLTPSRPVIETFSADKSDPVYMPGDSIGFSWTVQGGTTLALLGPDGRLLYEIDDPVDVGRYGATYVHASEVDGSYVYTLQVRNSAGETTTRAIAVEVDSVAD